MAFFEREPYETGKNIQLTVTNMAIECKKSEKPWVFFSTQMFAKMPLAYFIQYVSDFDLYFGKRVKTRSEHRPFLSQIRGELVQNHYNARSIPRCVTYCEPFKPAGSHSEIYDAVDSVLSYGSYELALRQEQLRDNGYRTFCYYPIIVFDGVLMEARVEGDEVNVVQQDYVQLRVFRSSWVFIIDVVRKQYFETILKKIERDHREMVKVIDNIRFPATHKAAMKKRYESELKARITVKARRRTK